MVTTDDDIGSDGAPEGGSYDLLRRRLRTTVRDTVDAADAIDTIRTEAFGTAPLRLVASDRLQTDLACRPRDMVRVGELLLLGYQASPDLAQIVPEHVFALYQRGADGDLTPIVDDARNFLLDPAFREEFDKLHRFYGKARFADLRRTQHQLLAAFRIGERVDDVAVLRWNVTADGGVVFVDARGDRDYTWPDAHGLRWVQSTREDQRAGAHPTISVLDEVFVGFRGGRLQLRVEDGSPGGRVELDEDVAVPGQSLADVGVAYAEIGEELAISVDLYSESTRYYLFGRRTRSGTRVDALGAASRVLPGGDGVVFPGGYHLATTGTRVFDVPADGMVFEEVIHSPNGEDLLYVFHHRETGEYLLAPYNLVRREISQLIPCHGFATMADGRMVLFRSGPDDGELARIHPVQWWDTPFIDEEFALATAASDDSWVGRVGNADLVAGLGDAFDVGQLADDSTPSERTWEAIIVAARRALDTHLWLADPEASDLHDGLRSIVTTSGLLVDEYAKVRRARAAAAATLADSERDVRRVVDASARADDPTSVVEALGSLRRARGEAALLSDIDQIDDAAVGALVGELDGAINELAERASDILDDDLSFAGFGQRLEALTQQGLGAETAADVEQVLTEVGTVTSDLDAVVDAVSALDSGDPTARTRIVRRVADVTAASNRARAQLDGRVKSLRSSESDEAFDAEVALLEQSLTGSVAGVSTPEDCDAELARLLVNLERIESRYGEEPERVERLIEVRERLNETLGARRSELVDERARRTQRLVDAAQRLLGTVTRRAAESADEADIAGFFAADQMVARVRSLADELEELGEIGRASELRSELAGAAESARLRVRDRVDLIADDGSLSFGGHRFAPNEQPFEVVLSTSSTATVASVTGTDFALDVTEQLSGFADLLDRPYPSESGTVARAEYLAWAVIDATEAGTLSTAVAVPERLAEIVRSVAEHRHGEGYELGVHDDDAARILTAVGGGGGLGDSLLTHSGRARGHARVLLATLDEAVVEQLVGQAQAARAARQRVGSTGASDRLRARLLQLMDEADVPLDSTERGAAAAALVDDLGVHQLALTTPSTAPELLRRSREVLDVDGRTAFDQAVDIATGAWERHDTAREWLGAIVGDDETLAGFADDVDEAAALVATPDVGLHEVPHAGSVVVTGLVSDHRRIEDGSMRVRLDELADRVGREFDQMSARWPQYQAARRLAVANARELVDLDAHRPQVMAGFVRNRLIDRALLPLIGANLGRQIGTTNASDLARSGLLVLTSPPGYGKTTLMAWLADRLGLLMVKVNGPALGTDTTSLDPADAPNAAARAEVEKINLALRMGRNIMLFIDDIQFTSPQLLSRFIPLADATRRIEGVADGEAVTYDLRGKRFAVVMAGNPYSTGGIRFELPDMLVNRADVHNLGDVADEHENDFSLSYLENSLTACPPLSPAAGKLVDDIEAVLAMAQGRRPESSDGLEHRWDGADLSETVRLVGLLDRAQETVMAVNAAYVASAAMADTDRVAPPFLLQGSYRNMARIASRVVPAMTNDELDGVVDDHYASEAQTLTDRAEQNLLALAALRDRLTENEAQRWATITDRWTAASVDPAAGVVGALDRIADALGSAVVPIVGAD